jgi:RNA polymerase sigma factor (TIGR02999 family)
VLQPTALVHEVYLRMIDLKRIDANGRDHFLALAARTLRRVLVDQVRIHGAAKRGGNAVRITLHSHALQDCAPAIELLALDEALSALRAANERRAEVIDLRFFGGLSIEETAAVLGVSARTVRDDWTRARAFLYQRLAGGDG